MLNPSMWRCLAGPNGTKEEDEKRVLKDFLVLFFGSNKFKYMYNTYSFHLAQIDWLIFGTLTWQSESLVHPTDSIEKLRHDDFDNLIEFACSVHHLRKRHLAFYAKSELGPTKRVHYNFLIAKENCKGTTPEALSATLTKGWKHGMALVEPFNHDKPLASVAYQAKLEYDSKGESIQPIEYFSPSLIKLFKNNSNAD